MVKKLVVINQMRPRIKSQGVVDLDKLAQRVSPNTTYNKIEVHSILQLCVEGVLAALEAGETIKIDKLVKISPNMKVGGVVNLSLRPDRAAIAGLNNPTLWTGQKVENFANLNKSATELLDDWDAANPGDPVEDR